MVLSIALLRTSQTCTFLEVPLDEVEHILFLSVRLSAAISTCIDGFGTEICRIGRLIRLFP